MNHHPTTAQLREFLEGCSPEGDSRAGQHAEQCPDCLAKLDGLVGAAVDEAPSVPPVSGLGPPGIPGYEVLGTLGRGGAGVVYKARQVALDRLVALKVLLWGADASAEERERFAREASVLGQLRHPNLVAVHDAGVHDGLPWLAMELVEGPTLRERLAQGPLPSGDAARLVMALAQAVAAAHEKGVVHRDLKPANVLLAVRHTPKVTDFGLARRLDGSAGTATGALLGTPGYMAPEQVRGAAVCKATDVWGLGVILYECLTGRPPFMGEPAERLIQTTEAEPPPPSLLRPGVPRDLDVLCMKCLSQEPARRYADAAALADDLGRFLEGRPIAARPAGACERLLRLARRNRKASALLAVVLLTLAGSAVGGLILWRRAESARAQAEERATRIQAVLSGVIKVATKQVGFTEKDLGTWRMDFLREAERHVRQLPRERPDDPELLLDVTRLYVTLGRQEEVYGTRESALLSFREARGFLRRVSAYLRNDANTLEEVASIHGRVALFESCAGSPGAALEQLRECERILERALALRPAYPLHCSLVRAGNEIAGQLAALGQTDKALRQVHRCRARLDDALAAYPDDLMLLHEQVINRGHEAGITRLREGDQAARQMITATAARIREFHQRLFTEIECETDTARLSQMLGAYDETAPLFRRVGGDPREALALALAARRVAERLVARERFPSNTTLHLFHACEQIGKSHVALGRRDLATTAWVEGVEVLRQAIRHPLTSHRFRKPLAERCLRLGRHVRGEGDLAGAACWFREAAEARPYHAATLREAAAELKQLAEGPGDLARDERERCRADIERLGKRAEALAPGSRAAGEGR
jgi:tetratricopeptide (TPR) repeat protein